MAATVGYGTLREGSVVAHGSTLAAADTVELKSGQTLEMVFHLPDMTQAVTSAVTRGVNYFIERERTVKVVAWKLSDHYIQGPPDETGLPAWVERDGKELVVQVEAVPDQSGAAITTAFIVRMVITALLSALLLWGVSAMFREFRVMVTSVTEAVGPDTFRAFMVLLAIWLGIRLWQEVSST